MRLSVGKLWRYVVPVNPTNAQRRESGNVLVLTNGKAEIRQPGRGRRQFALQSLCLQKERVYLFSLSISTLVVIVVSIPQNDREKQSAVPQNKQRSTGRHERDIRL